MSDSLPPQLIEKLLAQCADAVIYADRTGTIRLWNASAEQMFGFPASEALGQSLDIFIPERLRAAHWAGFDRAMASGRTKHSGRPTRTKALTRSGETVYVEMSFAVIAENDGTAIGSLAIGRLVPPAAAIP